MPTMEKLSTLKLPDNSEYYIQDDSAIASISRSGNTFTATKRDGSTFTFTQRDITISSSSESPNLITITDNDGNSYDVSIVLSDATQSAFGLMSSTDKAKLDGIESGAEVNQYAFSTIIITNIIDQDPDTDSDTEGPANQAIEVSTSLNADSKTDSFQIVAGDNVTLVPVEVADKVTINAKDTVYTLTQSQQDGHTFTLEDNDNHSTTITIPDNNTTYTISVDSQQGTLTLTPSEGQPVTVTIPFAGTASRAVADESGNNIKATYGASLSHSDASNSDINLVNKNGTVISTVSIANASQSEEGLMSASDKTKLDGVASGAEVNQNAFSRIIVGTTNVDAESKTDALTLIAGANVTLTPNATDDSVTIASSYTNTTYTLTQDTTDPRILTFTGSDGSSTSITTAGKTYTLTVGTGTDADNIILTSSTGDTYKITVPYATHADHVDNNLTIQLNGGTTEGTNKFTFNGSAAKSMDITKASVGLGNVDNTADADKSVSHASTADSATSAGSATKATQDESGNNIKASYGASLSHDSTNSNNRIDLVNKNGTSISNVTIADATTTQPGLLSTSDKTKLNGIASGAEVNQNAFSNVKVGSTTIAADAKTDTLELVAGDNVTLIPDASGDKITISSKDTTYTPASTAPGKVATNSAVGTSTNYARQDHTHGIDVATGDSNGQVKIAGQNVSVNGLGSAAYKNIVDTYSPTGTDAVSGKAIKAALDTLPEPMVFKGTVGATADAPTVTSLPVDGSANIGWTYKVVTNGTYAGIASKVGDTFVCLTKTSSANTWVLIPSGDEPSGTVTSVGLQNATNGGLTISGSPITSSGTITVGHSNVITAGTAKGDDSKTLTFGGTFTIPSVTYDANGHVTSKGTTTMTMPANPNTDTKVTSSANHYTPSTASGSDKSASASGATASWSIDVVKGVTLNTDGKGHVTGISVTSGKIPANPNTDRYVNSASFVDDSTNAPASPVKMTLTRAGSDSVSVIANIPKVSSSSAGVAPKGATVNSQSQSTKFLREDGTWAAPSYTTNTTYTFENGTNCFYVTPSGGTKQTVTVTPSITNNITGSGTSGYIAKFNGTNTITNGPAFGTSTTTWLNNKGEWTTPPNDNTTYTIATGDANGQIKVTPSSGSAYNVSVKGLGSNAYTSTAYVAKAGDTMTGNLTFSKPTTAGEKRGFVFAGVTDSAGLYYLEPNLSDDGRMRFVISDNDTDPIEMAWSLYRTSGSEIPGEHVVHSFNARGYTLTPIQEKSGAYNPISITCSVNNHGTIGSDSLKWKGIYATTFYGALQGNADTATSASSVPWTGVTNRPTKLSQFTNDITFATSIATSTGTNQITLALGGKYAITAGGTSYVFTMPSNPNTDANVAQTATNTNANYEVLFSGTADNTTRTEGARKYSNLLFNPSTGTLTTTKVSSTEIVCSTIDADTGNITDANIGNLVVTGAARFLNTINGSISGNAATATNVAWTGVTGKPSTYPPSAHDHSQIVTVGDKRSTATTPNDYGNKIIFQGLKNSSTIGSPSTDAYSYLIGLRGWTDSSGGNSHEFAFNNSGVYRRQGATDTWGSWMKLLDSTNYTDYTVKKDGTGASGTWGISISGNAATATSATTASYANYINLVATNEIRLGNRLTSNYDVWINYLWADGTASGTITGYRFGNGNRTLTKVYASEFNGNVVGNVSGTATRLYDNSTSIGAYVSGDTHYLRLGYWDATNQYDNSTLLVTSAFWGNQHGSADLINYQQANNTNSDPEIHTTMSRVHIGGSHIRKFYIKKDGTSKVWLYVYVTGGNSYGRWNVSVLQGDYGQWHWDYAANQPNTDLIEIGHTQWEGNAATATKSTQDSDGNAINTTYLKKSGGTLTGAINTANGTYNNIGDDVAIGDINVAGTLGIKGLNGATGIQLVPYSGSTAQKISINGSGTMTITGTVASTFSGNLTGNVTGNVSGSSGSCTGNAATATNVAWSGVTGKPSEFAPSSGSSYYVKTNRGASQSTATKGDWVCMCNSNSTGSPTLPTSGKWWHIFSLDCWGSGPNNWVSQLAIATSDGNGVWWRRNDSGNTSIDSSTWHRLAEGDASGNATNANKVNNLTVQTAVPANAVFTDTNYYHTTGSWSGLTYTATANGGAGALAFTIPTGTSATTVAVGNHNHNGTYVKVAGDSMTGTLCMNSANGNYGEGIRINAGNGGYSSFTIGTEANSTSGISDCGFWIGTNRTSTSYQRKLYVAHNASTASTTYFYASSASDNSPSLQVGGAIVGRGVVCTNAANSSTAGGLALYGTEPTTYGIAFRGTSNSGKHGYVQADWAVYNYCHGNSGTGRGWIFRDSGSPANVASISNKGNAVFSGSVTVGGNGANTSGVRQVYNATTQSLDFVFVA